MSGIIFHPSLNSEDFQDWMSLSMFQQPADSLWTNGCHNRTIRYSCRIGVLFLIDSSDTSPLRQHLHSSKFSTLASPQVKFQHLDISLLRKFASFLHSETYSWDYFLRRCCLWILGFLDWHCGGTLQCGLEFEVISIRTH